MAEPRLVIVDFSPAMEHHRRRRDLFDLLGRLNDALVWLLGFVTVMGLAFDWGCWPAFTSWALTLAVVIGGFVVDFNRRARAHHDKLCHLVRLACVEGAER